jgi:hypothetical protein
MLAGFMVMVYLVPVDSVKLRVHLPFNASFDRLGVFVLILGWVLLGGDQRTVWRSRRSKLYAGAAALFAAILVAGVLANGYHVITLGEWTAAEKQLIAVLALISVGWFASTALRAEDLYGFATLLIALGTITAVGIVIEARTGHNYFYTFSGLLLKPIANVPMPGTALNGVANGAGRVSLDGPTSHGLAAASMMAMTMPFALVRVFDLPPGKSRWLNAAAVGLMVAAAVSTQEKTSLVSILMVFIFLGIFRPRHVLKMLPFVPVLIVVIHIAAPGSLGAVTDPTRWFGNASTNHRAADLTAIMPDVAAHPLLGRGFGTFDAAMRPDLYRITDDQLLSLLWQAGALGLLSYAFMIISPIIAARRARRSRDPAIRMVALAASAGCVAYLVVNALFDALSFVQAPYIFFIIAAMCTAASGAPDLVRAAVARERELLRPAVAAA